MSSSRSAHKQRFFIGRCASRKRLTRTPSVVLDVIGATEGDVLYRGASAWLALAPGTSGQVLQTQGAGATPQWANAGSVSSVATGQGLSGGTITTSGTLTTAAGVDTNTLNAKTANYTIASTDCGSTVQAGSGSTGLFVVTLPSVSGFNGACTVNVKNGDTARNKGLSGFPADLGSTLWPLQALTVKIINGVWATTVNPGRYKMTGALTLNVNHASGSDNPLVADGLATGASAFATIQNCLNVAQNQLDTQNQNVSCLNAAESFTENNVLFAGQPVGTNRIFITGAGVGSSTWNCSSADAVGSKDNGEIIVAGFAFRASGSCATFLFQQGGGGVIDVTSADFGAITGDHMACTGFGNMNMTGAYTISGTAVSHVRITGQCYFTLGSFTVSMPNVISMTGGFYIISGPGMINSAPVTYSGSGAAGGTVGQQWNITGCGALYRGTSTIPGNSAGSPAAAAALTSSNCAFLN